MQINPDSALGRALTGQSSKREQLENVQNTLVAQLAEKRRELATLSGDEATAMRAKIIQLEKLLDGAFEMGAELDASGEDGEQKGVNFPKQGNGDSSVFDVKSIAAQHRAARYGHLIKPAK